MKSTIGFTLSAFWLLFGFFVWYFIYDSSKLELGELGTLVAGWFSPLAFMWFIIAYYQQKEELSLNTRALELQKEEMIKQVEFLKIQSSAMTDAAKNINEHTRPYLTLSFHKNHRNIYVILQNSGIRSAINPILEFSNPLYVVGRKNIDHNLFHNINSIAPRQNITHFLINMPMLLSDKKEVQYETIVNIQYYDSDGNTYKDSIPLSLKVAKNELITPPDLETSLYKIPETHKELLQQFKKT